MTRTRVGTAILAAAAALGGPVAASAQPADEPPPIEEEAPPADEPAPVDAPVEAPPVVVEPPIVEAELEPAGSSSYGYDKGFYLEQEGPKGAFKLRVGARVQVGFEGKSAVDADDEQVNTGAFLVRRARLTLDGHAYTERLKYKFQTDFGRGFVTLKDFFVDVGVGDRVWVRAGQYKRPFSRQQITSSGRLELVERARTDRDFGGGRDIGVAVHNGYEKSPEVEWVVGVFNGTGDSPRLSGITIDPDTGATSGGSFSTVPRDLYPVLVARAGLNSEDLKGYSEGDFEGGPLRWGVGASVVADAGLDTTAHTESHKAEVDFIVKSNGMSATGGVYLQTAETELSDLGAFAQLGFVVDKTLNVAARYATLIPQGDGAEDASHEITVGGGWYPYAHDAKLQAEIGSAIAPGTGVADSLLFRLQAQLSF